MRIVQVVPRLAPPLEGVGGFATALAAALAANAGIATRFLVGDPSWQPADELLQRAPLAWEGSAAAVAARTSEALVAGLEDAGAATVLVHYSNYGYQRRGCPAWLVEGLVRWRARGAGRRLVTLFHEVYATGPPWRSSFWTSPLQRRLAAALAGTSARLATSLALYRDLLQGWVPGRTIALLPVFSTVGEPAAVPPLAARQRRLVVFGGAGVRGRGYRRHLPALAAACRALDVVEVLDVGPPGAAAPASVAGVPLRATGPLPDAEVSALLGDALGGFLAYPPAFLAKSTIFAAYCAHGTLPVCAWTGAAGGEAPAAGRHFWLPSTRNGAVAPAGPQRIADAARSWYGGHALARQAAVYRELLGRELLGQEMLA